MVAVIFSLSHELENMAGLTFQFSAGKPTPVELAPPVEMLSRACLKELRKWIWQACLLRSIY